MMLEAIRMIESNSVKRLPQNKLELGYQKRRTPEDSQIDWNQSSYQLHNFISALVNPMPNAFCNLNRRKVEFKKSIIGKAPGIVLGKLQDNSYVISTGDGVILVTSNQELQVGDKLS